MNPEQPAPIPPKRTSRRTFIKRSLAMATGAAITGLIYSGVEACWINVVRLKVAVPRLPKAFHGTTIALLTDIHHGPYTGLGYLEKIVEMTNAIQPDLIALGGDYTHHGRKYIAPAMRTLANLKARLGVYAVPGNHEYYDGIDDWRNVTAEVGLDNIENSGRWIEQNNSAFYLAGVDDYWRGKPSLKKATAQLSDNTACLLLNHNPDFVEIIEDERIGLVMSGHTHGGQVVFPIIGAPILPSHFGQKYLHGLVQGPKTKVYVSRGLGTITPPLRFCAPPELTVLEMQSDASS